jgi:hypothetical protein
MTEINTTVNSYSSIENVEMNTVKQTLGKINQFQQLIKNQLQQGQDYGIIPGTSKPTLLKPGAEKILMLMGLTSKFDILDSTRDFESGFFQYQVKCRLYKDRMLITEGLGACNTREKKYLKQDAYTIDNTALKMAKKRSLVDATLLIASLSQIFTQDMEDIPRKWQPPSTITAEQIQQIYAISGGNAELCRKVLANHGYTKSKDVLASDYSKICAEIRKLTVA